MEPSHGRYRDTFRPRTRLSRALLGSIGVHLLVVLAAAYVPEKAPPTPKMIAYDVEFVSAQENESEAEAPAAEVTPPAPEPEPPPPEPEPEPEPEPPKPEPEPEPVAKEEPAPEPEPEPKKEEKPEPPKPEPKKVEPKKVEPKKEPPKETPKAEAVTPKPVQVAKATPTLQPAEAPNEPASSGPQLKQQLPSALNGWARLVQRKVDKFWSVPGGIRATGDGAEAVISFWIDRQGRLIGRPEIIENGADPALAESGVRAVMAANPLPPLPDSYSAQEQQVIFAFSAVK